MSHDVVMGRTFDGGYYLIGVRGDHDVLTGVPMSTTSAADALAAGVAVRGLSLAEVPATFDIEEEPDLQHLRIALAPEAPLLPRRGRPSAARDLAAPVAGALRLLRRPGRAVLRSLARLPLRAVGGLAAAGEG